jgi:alginate O-acetyltransferase complex protein AlgJ
MALEAAKARGDVFHPTDTHWTALGSLVAAESISQAISEAFPALVLPRADFAAASSEEVEFTGDLVSYLSLGSLEERLGPPRLRVTLTSLRRVDEESLGLFGTPEIPVTLVGTSYSADPRWGFEAALKRTLESDVLTVASEGRGPFAPMEGYLTGDTVDEFPPRLVIWEIPERYVTPAQ